MSREHFLLKCNNCKWHLEIDEACNNSNLCPQCGKYNVPNLVQGTKEELIKYIKEHLT